MKKIIFLLLIAHNLFAQDQPNIILILVDDLGHGEISYNQKDYFDTPNVDYLIENGLHFERFYVHSQCSPTRAALMTGQYPWRYGMNYSTVQPDDWGRGIPLDKTILPEKLKELGYNTAIIGKWHLGNGPERGPKTQGYFDYQFGLNQGHCDYFSYDVANNFDLMENGVSQRRLAADKVYITDLFKEKAIDYIQQASNTGNPFFLYLPLTAPHGPYQCPIDSLQYTPRKFENHIDSVKYWMVKIMDNLVGEVINEVKVQNIEDNTIIIWGSDNGASFEEDSSSIRSNAPFKGFKGSYYEGGINVPFVFYFKNKIKTQKVEADVAGHIVDIFPSLIGLAGGKVDDNCDGEDLSILWKGRQLPERTIYLDVVPDRRIALFRNGFKLLKNPIGAGNRSISPKDGVFELYNVLKDPSENNSLYGKSLSIETKLINEMKKAEKEFVNISYESEEDNWFQGYCSGMFHRLGFWKEKYPKEKFLPSKR